jgi:hypothetical protein
MVGVGGESPRPFLFIKEINMPKKYGNLASHADAKPKAGTKTSSYPKSKGKMGKPKKAGKY